MDSEFRPLDTRERELLEKLLEVEFPGRQEWRSQLVSMTAKQIEEDGTLLLRCESCLPLVNDADPPLPTKYKLGIEGTYKDADGGEVAILLHADRYGFLGMLEIIKYDGSPIIDPPSVLNVIPLPPEDRGGKPGS